MPAARVSHYSSPNDEERMFGPPVGGGVGKLFNSRTSADKSFLFSQTKNRPDETRSAYDMVVFNLNNDPKWMKEVGQGRRIGFYRFRGELGQGNFSTVKLAHHQLTKDKVAVKIIEKSKLDQKTHKMLAKEIANMDIAAHPNIIRLFEVVETLSRIHLVLEFAPGGELFNKISTEGRVKESEATHLFAQVVSAVSYLHSVSIIHRDIKAENVFLTTRKTVKLGDFGFSTRVSRLAEQLSTFCGSPPYAAPELYKDESYEGPGVDIWALGVLLFFVLTADMPFKAATVATLKRQILGGTFLIPSYISNDARDLISRLMMQDPKERLQPDKALLHSWYMGRETISLDSMPSHVTVPRRLSSSEPLTEVEEEVYKQMDNWGVGRSAISQAADFGAKSTLVATYRILIHGLLKEYDEDYEFPGEITPPATSDEDTNITSPTTKSPNGSRCFFRKRKLFFRNGLFIKSGDQRSKGCAIL